MVSVLNKLRPDHWAWIHAKLVMILWAVTIFLYPPNLVLESLGFLLGSIMSSVTVVGIIISLVGLVQTLTDDLEKTRKGLRLEIFGLYLALGGPFAYFASQIYLSFGFNGPESFARSMLAYAVCAFLIVRIVILSLGRRGLPS